MKAKTKDICKGCEEPIVGFDTDGYCEDCLCPQCGTTLETDNERGLGICEDCESEDES